MTVLVFYIGPTPTWLIATKFITHDAILGRLSNAERESSPAADAMHNEYETAQKTAT